MMKNVILYGILGADQQYRVAKYWVIRDSESLIESIIFEANMMVEHNPSIKHVYAVDQRPGLRRDYIESIKENSIASCYEFKDILEREGLKII